MILISNVMIRFNGVPFYFKKFIAENTEKSVQHAGHHKRVMEVINEGR